MHLPSYGWFRAFETCSVPFLLLCCGNESLLEMWTIANYSRCCCSSLWLPTEDDKSHKENVFPFKILFPLKKYIVVDLQKSIWPEREKNWELEPAATSLLFQGQSWSNCCRYKPVTWSPNCTKLFSRYGWRRCIELKICAVINFSRIYTCFKQGQHV